MAISSEENYATGKKNKKNYEQNKNDNNPSSVGIYIHTFKRLNWKNNGQK